MTNIILNVDSYKVSMPKQYPSGTSKIYSYIESRGGIYDHVVFFGLQAFIKEYLLKPITKQDIDEAEMIWSAHGEPFDRSLWDYILEKHAGYLPVEIKAVAEGTVVPTQNVLVTIENTDDACFWLTTHIETALLRAVWYPTTVATNSREIKKVIVKYLDKTGTVEEVNFKLHDFGARGCSSHETAGLGGMAHLVNFMGTDTIAAVVAARKYYNIEMAGFSIPAAEHSTITSWGREGEVDAYRNMLKQFAKPGSLVAVVSDSYDIFNAVTEHWGKALKDEVVKSGATVIVRPDSGVPHEVVLEIAQRLEQAFGVTRNKKGYKVLNNVRIIQGDGINIDSVKKILSVLTTAGFSADNVAFGMGGALLQAPQRDDQKFAMKASAALVNGKWVDVFKDPVTDTGKRSKKGKLVLVEVHGIGTPVIQTMSPEYLNGREDLLKTVFLNGEILVDDTFENIRARAIVEPENETYDRY